MKIEGKHGELLPKAKLRKPFYMNPVAGSVMAGGVVLAVLALSTLVAVALAMGAGWVVYNFLVGWNREEKKHERRDQSMES